MSVCMYLIGATEERFPSMHLHQDAAQGPHVDGQVVGHPKQHLRGTVEPALDVLVDLRGGVGLSREEWVKYGGAD